MVTPVGKLVVELGFDGSKFTQGITQAKRELSSFGKTTDTTTRAMVDSNYSMKTSSIALNNMKNHYKALDATMGQNLKRMAEMRASGQYSEAHYAQLEREVSQYQAQMYKLNEDYKRHVRASAVANSSFTKMGNTLQSVSDGFIKVGGAMSTVGSGLQQIGAVATAGGAVFVKQAMDFERGLVAVQKTTNATSGEMNTLSKEIRGMAKEMPMSVHELTNLASVAGQLGVAQKDLSGFVETVAKIGSATNLSAEEASQSLARFINITGSSIDTVENLGSTLVHLGNNFATSEREIMMMSNRLVGTMSVLGASDHQIMGLATALSSLGVNAEMGGSAMSRFARLIAKNVAEGEESLTNMAQVAGMSADAFAKAFREDPIDAIQAFVNGLAQSEDAVKTLNDLGIKEQGMVDTLLKLAGGYDVLTDALATAREGYQENIALNDEYAQMLESTHAQWEVFKNNLTDVAITVGSALLPAILNLMSGTDGLMSSIQGLADWFVNLDGNMQTNLLKWTLFATIGGTVISVLGSLMSSFGAIIGVIASVAKGIGELSGAFVAWRVGDITGKVAKLASVMGNLGTVMSFLSNPIVAVTGATIGLALVYRHLTKDAREANQAMADFPDISGVTVAQADSLRGVSKEIQQMSVGLETLHEHSDLSMLSEGIAGVGNEIQRLNTQKINEVREALSSLPPEVQEALKGSVDAYIEQIEGSTDRVGDIIQRINQLMAEGMDETGALSRQKLMEIEGLTHEMLSHYAMALSEDMEQYQEILGTLTKSVTQMTEKELVQRGKIIGDAIRTETEMYEQQMEDLHQLAKDGVISAEEALTAREVVTKAHHARMTALNKEQAQVELELFRQHMEKLSEHGKEIDFAKDIMPKIEEIAEKFGMTVEEVEAMWNGVDLDGKPIDDLREKIANMSHEARSAFNKLLEASNELGKSFAEIGDDELLSFIDKIKEAGVTWDELELLSKDANVDDNMKEFIQRVMEASSEWNFLTPEEKQARLEVEGIEPLEELIEKYTDWESFEDGVKNLSVDVTGMDAFEQVLVDMGIWEQLDPAEKRLIVEGKVATQEVADAIEQQNLWNNSEFLDKLMKIDTNAPEAEEAFRNLMAEYDIIPSDDVKHLTTETNASTTEGELRNLESTWFEKLVARILGGDTQEFNTSTNAPETEGELDSLNTTLDETTTAIEAGAEGEINTNAPETEGELADLKTQTDISYSRIEDGARGTVSVTDNASSVIDRVVQKLNNLNGRVATVTIQAN